MNPILLDLMPAVREGYCCSQLLFKLLLDVRGEDNPGMLRAMHGLCHGIGQSEGPCGLLSGGACVLGFLAGKGRDGEEANGMLEPLLNEYATWFYERTAPYGGYTCPEVAQGLGGRQADGTINQVACGELLADCWEKIGALAEDYGLDPMAHGGEE